MVGCADIKYNPSSHKYKQIPLPLCMQEKSLDIPTCKLLFIKLMNFITFINKFFSKVQNLIYLWQIFIMLCHLKHMFFYI